MRGQHDLFNRGSSADRILYGRTRSRERPPLREYILPTGSIEYYDHHDLVKIALAKGDRREYVFDMFIDGPAIIYLEDNQPHNADGPAIICEDGHVEYAIRGKRHRDPQQGPAVVEASGTKEYWFEGKLHRDPQQGPAIIGNDGTKEYWVEDKKHRNPDEGPAVVDRNGTKEYWQHGVRIYIR